MRSIALVDGTNCFEKAFESEKRFMREGWCLFANAAARDVVGTRYHLTKHGWIRREKHCDRFLLFSQQVDTAYS